MTARHPDCTCRNPHGHGSYITYTVHACRCAPCRDAARTKRAEYKAERRERGGQRRTWPVVDLIEEVEHLRSLGLGLDDCANRLGLKPSSVERVLHRAGRSDLARTTLRREL